MTLCNLGLGAVLMFIVSVYLFSLNEIKPKMKEQRRKPASANKDLVDEKRSTVGKGNHNKFLRNFFMNVKL